MTTLLPRGRTATAPRTARAARDTAVSSTLSRLRGNRVLNSLTFPHGVEGYADAFRPAVGAGAITATVEAVTPRTARASSILLRPHQPVTFAAGQHVLVTTQIDGARQTRCYSLSDTPHRPDGLLEITVAHLPEGLVSTHLVDGIAAGDALGLSAPQGHDFVMPASRPEHVVLIGGGSGVTPLRSMWRTMAAEGLADRVRVLYYARTAEDAIFLDEIEALPASRVVFTRAEGSSGRFTSAHLDEVVDGLDPAGTTIHVCGPAGLVAAVTGAHAERFPGAAAAATAGARPVLRSESFAPVAAPTDPDAAGGVLTFARSGRSAHDEGRTLLEEAESAGLTPAAGCRMGICHTCVTTKHAGVVRDVRTGQDDDGGTCEVQLCISQAVGDVQLDL